MAHQISIRDNGQVEAVYRNDPAWHGLGTVFQSEAGNRLTSERAIELGGLDWDVKLEPMQLPSGIIVPGYNAITRGDSGAVLGVVGDRYVPFQNREAFGFLDSFVQDGALEYEAAFALRGGATVVLLARMPEVDNVAEGDDCMRYILCSTSHDGTAPIYMQPTSVRVQCANMLRVALSDTQYQVSIKHTGSMAKHLETARQYLSQFNEGFTLFRDSARVLATKQYGSSQATEFLQRLFPMPQGDDEKAKKAQVKWAKRIGRVMDKLLHPSNQLASIKGTWWQLVNAVTFDVDHEETRTRGKSDRQRKENVFLQVSEGKGAELKNRAMTLALEMAV